MGFFKECKGCDSRFPGCHSQCEKYLKEKAEYDALMKAEQKKKDVGMALWIDRSDKVSRAKSRRYSRGYANGKKI